MALVHDLASSLSSLNLDIEALKAHNNSQALLRVKKRVKQLNKVLHAARRQMNGRYTIENFNIPAEVSQIVTSLEGIARKASITLDWHPPLSSMSYVGEKILFQQIVAILIKNAIDSYEPVRSQLPTGRRVYIQLLANGKSIELTITDWGKGIKPDEQEHIFEPFYSTKKNGMGIGLYLTKRFIQDRFGGTITVQIGAQQTTFSISLPKHKAIRHLGASETD